MPKYLGKQIFYYGKFPEVGQKQKTECKCKCVFTSILSYNKLFFQLKMVKY